MRKGPSRVERPARSTSVCRGCSTVPPQRSISLQTTSLPVWMQRPPRPVFFSPVTIAGQYRGVAMQAVEPGYPDHKVVLICEVYVRRALGLTDVDQITFSASDA